MEFSIYLDSLEKYFIRGDEKSRALTFFAKLRLELRNYITLYAGLITGKTREEMV